MTSTNERREEEERERELDSVIRSRSDLNVNTEDTFIPGVNVALNHISIQSGYETHFQSVKEPRTTPRTNWLMISPEIEPLRQHIPI